LRPYAEIAWRDQDDGSHRLVLKQDGRITSVRWKDGNEAKAIPMTCSGIGSRASASSDWRLFASAEPGTLSGTTAMPSGGYSGAGGRNTRGGSTSSTKSVTIYDLDSGEPTMKLTGASLIDFAFDPSGKRLAVVDSYGQVAIGNVSNGGFDVEAMLPGGYYPAISLAWHPKGQQLATCNSNGVVNLWNADPSVSNLEIIHLRDPSEYLALARDYFNRQNWSEYHNAITMLDEQPLNYDQKQELLIIKRDARTYSTELFARAQQHLRVRSGYNAVQCLNEIVRCNTDPSTTVKAKKILKNLGQ
jgi:WD40 repeat protein